MKIIKTVVVLILCFSWIFVTNYKYEPVNSLGTLLTYKSGLLSISNDEESIRRLSGTYEPKIFVDDVGVPHVFGQTNNDLAFGLGYMHAKDRYFQMEMITRTVQGKLSEIFGEQTLKTDTFWRPYGFEQKSKELLEEYRTNFPEFYNYLMAYAEGVNKYLGSNELNDPMYTIIGESARMWKAEYSLQVNWYMSWSLTYFDNHIDHQEVLAKLSDDERNYFYPMQPEGLKTILESKKKEEDQVEKKEYLEAIVSPKKGQNKSPSNPLGFHQGIGSNNWVVKSLKTKNGKPLLANDPHLFLTLPEAFYETHLVSEQLKVYGFSIPGVPVIVSGHNDKVSWGITNGEWDLVDRYKLKTKNDSLYLYDGKWIPIEEKKYIIKIKGGTEKSISQKHTIHGKIVQEDDQQVFAQYWHAANKSNSVKSVYNLMHSQNWNDFIDALSEYSYPPQNFIYADTKDNIGIVCAGKLPNRDPSFRGGVLDGTIKLKPIAQKDTLWSNYNPETKFLFSANQQPIQNETYFGHHGHKGDYRVNRIYSLLEQKNDWGPNEIKEMQMDEIDLSFEDFKGLMESYKTPKEYQKLMEGLIDWNGDMKGDNHYALVYGLLKKGIEKEAERFAKQDLKVNRAPSSKYFTKYLKDHKHIVSNGSISKQEMYTNILNYADSTLQYHHGQDWKEETYKNMSSINIYNISFIPGLGERIEGVGGNENTINMNTSYHHPVFRSIYEMKEDTIKGFTILAGGQSGKINSMNYKDQLDLWKNGEYKETQFENNSNRLKNIKNTIFFKK